MNLYLKETLQRYGGKIGTLVCTANLRNIPSEYRSNVSAAQNANPQSDKCDQKKKKSIENRCIFDFGL